MQTLDNQYVTKRFAKDRLSCSKRWPFIIQKTAFCTVKDGLLQGMLPQGGI